MRVPSYRPAGRPLLDLSELILVKGMEASWLYKLNQYITAIPKNFNLDESKNNIESNNVTNPMM